MEFASIQRDYDRLCQAGSVVPGFRALKAIPDPCPRTIALTDSVERRFFAVRPELEFDSGLSWLNEVLEVYGHYLVAVLTMRTTDDELRLERLAAERQLLDRLRRFVSASCENSMAAVEEALSERISEADWNFLGGVTLPYYGPYIYRDKAEVVHSIELPNGVRDLTVFELSGFQMLSWLDFATFGRVGTGGWAKPEGLYCVIEKYDRDSEAFRVQYLKHEAQHVDDYVRYPGLRQGFQTILEFRAKLAELVYAESLSGLNQFVIEATFDPITPHIRAAHELVSALREQLGLLEGEDLKVNCLSELKEVALAVYHSNTAEIDCGRFRGEDVDAWKS